MKVFDIINEAPSGEAVGFINKILKAVAWSVGKGARAQAAEQLSSAWATKMLEAGTIRVSMPVGVIKDATLAADRAIMDEAYKEAVKAFRKAERAGLIKDIKAGTAVAKEKIGTVLTWGKNIFIFGSYAASILMAGSLVKEYNDQADKEHEILKRGEQTPEQYMTQIGALRLRLVGELGAVMATTFLAGMVTGTGKLASWAGSKMIQLLTFNKWRDALSPVASLFTTATAGVQAYFVYELTVNKRARELLIDLILSDTVVMRTVVGVAGGLGNEAGVSHPFIDWAIDTFNKAKEKETTTTPQRPTSQPTQSGKEPGETSSGIDWSKVK